MVSLSTQNLAQHTGSSTSIAAHAHSGPNLFGGTLQKAGDGSFYMQEKHPAYVAGELLRSCANRVAGGVSSLAGRVGRLALSATQSVQSVWTSVVSQGQSTPTFPPVVDFFYATAQNFTGWFGPQPSATGASLSLVPDVDGDGRQELAIGGWDSSSGAASVLFSKQFNAYHGLYSDLTYLGGEVGMQIQGEYNPSIWSGFGTAVTGIKTNGQPMLVVGAPTYTNYGNFIGKVYAFPVSAPAALFSTLVENLPNLVQIVGNPFTGGITVQSNPSLQCFSDGNFAGASLASGDVDGDGLDDMMISQPGGYGCGKIGPGQVVVLYAPFTSSTLPNIGGAGYVLLNQWGVSAQGPTSAVPVGFDSSVSQVPVIALDLNNDGYADLVAGAPYNTPGALAGAGQACVVFGSPNRFAGSMDASTLGPRGIVFPGIAANGNLGASLGAADVNGDGVKDLLIGAPGQNQVFVVFGNKNLAAGQFNLASLNGENGFVINGPSTSSIGGVVGPAGDLNWDGIGDLGFADQAGTGYVLFGQKAFAPAVSTSQLNGANGFSLVWSGTYHPGFAVSAVNSIDWNGDGHDDLIVGVPSQNSVYIFTPVPDSSAPATPSGPTSSGSPSSGPSRSQISLISGAISSGVFAVAMLAGGIFYARRRRAEAAARGGVVIVAVEGERPVPGTEMMPTRGEGQV